MIVIYAFLGFFVGISSQENDGCQADEVPCRLDDVMKCFSLSDIQSITDKEQCHFQNDHQTRNDSSPEKGLSSREILENGAMTFICVFLWRENLKRFPKPFQI
ncbi:unnamed protein product, partial [Mesorhabditis belari]|uniref:Uncharacterized protein n=1 Tax=Mesorhabditis belari TaxID=2138241 RepID=A0AAF3J7D5_9BILA